MIIVVRMIKTSGKNKLKRRRSTPGTPMSTPKVSTRDDRMDVRIPKRSKIYQYLDVDKNIIKIPKWQRLDALLTIAERNYQDLTEKAFEEFVARIAVLDSHKARKIEKLRQLILWKILWEEEITEEYYQKIREL